MTTYRIAWQYADDPESNREVLVAWNQVREFIPWVNGFVPESTLRERGFYADLTMDLERIIVEPV